MEGLALVLPVEVVCMNGECFYCGRLCDDCLELANGRFLFECKRDDFGGYLAFRNWDGKYQYVNEIYAPVLDDKERIYAFNRIE